MPVADRWSHGRIHRRRDNLRRSRNPIDTVSGNDKDGLESSKQAGSLHRHIQVGQGKVRQTKETEYKTIHIKHDSNFFFLLNLILIFLIHFSFRLINAYPKFDSAVVLERKKVRKRFIECRTVFVLNYKFCRHDSRIRWWLFHIFDRSDLSVLYLSLPCCMQNRRFFSDVRIFISMPIFYQVARQTIFINTEVV